MCIVKVYLPPRTQSKHAEKLQKRIEVVMLGPEKICPKLTTDINWHFQRDILSTASHRNITIEVISFTGILYQVAIIRRNLAQKIVEASRVIFPQADMKITCVVDYPHDDYGFWRYPTV